MGQIRIAKSTPSSVASRRELLNLRDHIGAVYGVAMSGEGWIAVSALDDQALKVWEVQSGEVLATQTPLALPHDSAFVARIEGRV